MKLKKNCSICKIEFEYRSRPDRNRQYCTPICKKKFNLKVKLTCPLCKKEHFRSPSQIKRSFCSKTCRDEGQKAIHGGPLAFWAIATEKQKIERIKYYFDQKVIKTSDNECWGWKGFLDHDGYAKMNAFGKNSRASRMSWLIHNGPIPNNLWVLHHCDVRICTNYRHLFLGDANMNNQDMIKKGRCKPPIGERNSFTKLTSEQVQEIRILLKATNLSQQKIADKYNVTQSTIWRIKDKITWKHLKD